MFVGTVHDIDLVTRTIARTFPIQGITQGLSVNPAGDRLLVANEGGFLTDLNLTTGTWVNYAAVGGLFGLATRAQFGHATATVPYASSLQVFLPTVPLMKPPFPFAGESRRVTIHQARRTTIVTNPWGWVEFYR